MLLLWLSDFVDCDTGDWDQWSKSGAMIYCARDCMVDSDAIFFGGDKKVGWYITIGE